MRAIIPVAGIGTRLRPHTHTQPKALMHVAGKPILAHIVDELVTLGIDDVVLVVGHLGEQIEAYARKRYARIRLHFVPQGEPLGNGHAVYVAKQHLDGSPVLIIFGDTIIKGDLAALLRSERSLAGVKEVEDPRRLGVVELDGQGNVRRLLEKPEHPPTNLAVIGAYLIRNSAALRTALERLVREDRRARGEFWLADGLQLMIDAGERLGTFRVDHWYDCGTVEALLAANRDLLKLEPPPVRPDLGETVIQPSYVDPSASIEASVIGPDASIAEGARISRSTITDSVIGPHASVQDSRLKHSIVGENAAVKGRKGRVNVGGS